LVSILAATRLVVVLDKKSTRMNMSAPLIISTSSPFINGPEAIVLDASWLYEPDPPTRNAYEEFQSGPRFPNARFWDLDAVSEPHADGYVLMLPSPERFAAYAGKTGIRRDSHVIVYDGEGVFAAPRTAWTFKVDASPPHSC
jgi:thiosulfate/3-mercaptopyruvate sulfurtransferase